MKPIKIFQVENKIISNKRIKENYFHCVVSCLEIAPSALPGQFVNIRVAGKNEPLLRRPLSIHRVKGKNIELFYEVVGDATKILSQKKPGEYLDIIGPLGNGFDLSSALHRQKVILVSGGMGVAPLLFLAEKLKHKKICVLIGARSKKDINCEKEFKKIGCNVKIATDDGSLGFKGRVTDLLKRLLSDNNCSPEAIYACGPHPMLKVLAMISQEFNIPAQVSLEEHMACGVGACLGCVVETSEGLKRVCKEGPVFYSKDIIW